MILDGIYIAKLCNIDVTKSKDRPILKAQFVVTDGEYLGEIIFYNQLLLTDYQINSANYFLRCLQSGLKIKYENFNQYHSLVCDVYMKMQGEEFMLYVVGDNHINIIQWW